MSAREPLRFTGEKMSLNPSLILTFVLLAAAPARADDVEWTNPVQRLFAGAEIVQQFHVEGEGDLALNWRNRVSRALLDEGRIAVRAPADVSLPFKAPEVNAFVRVLRQVTLFTDTNQPIVSKFYPIDIYPDDILSDLAKAWGDRPPLGVVDPLRIVSPVLESAGIPNILLQPGIPMDRFDGDVVLIAPGGNAVIGIAGFLKQGRTLIFLEQNSPWESDGITALPLPEQVIPAALPLAANHPLFLGVPDAALENWGGAGRVASRPLAQPACPGSIVWLAAKMDDTPYPLLVEEWNDSGRVIFCQLEVGAQLRREPIAQMLLRNLIVYAFTSPAPRPVRLTRFAVPPQAVRGGKFHEEHFIREPADTHIDFARALLVVPETIQGTPSLKKLLADGGTLIIQSAFDEETLAAVNSLTDRDEPPIRLLPADPTDEPPTIDYANPLVWGVTAREFRLALTGDEKRATFDPSDPDIKPLTRPAILVKYPVGKGRLLLLRAPLAGAGSQDASRIVGRLVANLAFEP
jgi:hypothetical protein